ncbi:AraC-type DNA-binding protein [Pedobacter terrae]|uniref:AraC-type DNA-binding protein n=1 Tax=Pedobacter terrae TaxID=405671 RepID=A0A1G7MVF6_9SPHI|nr:helix-turn-helix domain-containing protein [Pedobacter terrae]SDF65724.1 AraC-type DNA-binding protein [Pedobacter terrae]
MAKKVQDIPVNILPKGTSRGIMMLRKYFDGYPDNEQVRRSHRDHGYTFILQETGITHIEIDFQTYSIQAPAIIYLHPNQVHRIIAFEKAELSTWIIEEEHLHPEYLKMLNNLVPVSALVLSNETLSILSQMVAVSYTLLTELEANLYHNTLKESINTLAAFITSLYQAQSHLPENHNRFNIVARAFGKELELRYKTVKRPALYADFLNLSVSYLNECVKIATGQSISNNIHQRIILEAKRLLYHSDKSVKEIANELGYDDYSYFIRLFVKVTGSKPLHFRRKNRE